MYNPYTTPTTPVTSQSKHTCRGETLTSSSGRLVCETMITASINKASEMKEVEKEEIVGDPSDCDSKQEVAYQLVKESTLKPSSVTETEPKKEISETVNNDGHIDRVPSPKKKSNSKSSSTDNASTDRTVISVEKMTEQDNTTDVVPSVSDEQGQTASIASNGDTPADSKEVKKSSKKSSSPAKSPFRKRDVPWDAKNEQDFDSDGEWGVEDFGKDSPGVWDPATLKKQTGELDPWNEGGKSPARIQDLPSPALADPPSAVLKSNSDEEEWPFKSPCAFQAKKGRALTPKSAASSGASTASDIDSQTSSPVKVAAAKLRKNDVDRSGSDDVEDAGEKEGDAPVEAWRKRESWKAERSANGAGGHLDPPEGETQKRSTKSKNSAPTRPTRGSRSRPDADDGDDNDQAPAKPKNRKEKDPSGDHGGDEDGEDADRPVDPKRRSKAEASDDEELKKGSFHGLVKDADKVRTKSNERRSRKLRGGRRRRSLGTSDDADEELGDDTVIKLAGEVEGPNSSRKKSWRDRRADNRENRARSLSADGSSEDEATTKSGRRPPSSQRALVARASSERWRKTVDGQDDSGNALGSETIQRKARSALLNTNADLSRSGHSARRTKSGGLEGMSRSFQAGNAAKNTRAARKAHSSDALGTASYHQSYDMNLSGHSRGTLDSTLDSIEDLEDFEHVDFQTPGMVNYDAEIHDLMKRANPEHTTQLNRRVHRRRENVTYDQNMPMMTRQALLTRQAGSQVARGRVDPSGIDRGRLELKNSTHERKDASLSNHRGRFTPGRRAPPRTRSSTVGMMRPAGEVPSFMQQQPQDASDDRDRRQLFKSRSSTQTNSFRQYLNKPNKVAQLSSRRPSASGGEAIDRHSARPAPSEPVERRGGLQRAKSTTELRRPVRTDPREVTDDRDEAGRNVESRAGADDMPALKPSRTKDEVDEDSDIESDDSSVDSMAEDVQSPMKPVKSKASKSSPPTVIRSPSPKKKVFNKRDFTVERSRRKLHSMMYEHKMGITMKDLLKQVKNGDPIKSPKSPVKSVSP
jgi:hypothetical protein